MYVKSGRHKATHRSVPKHVATGVAGAAMVGLGALVAAGAASEEPSVSEALHTEVALVNDETPINPFLYAEDGSANASAGVFTFPATLSPFCNVSTCTDAPGSTRAIVASASPAP